MRGAFGLSVDVKYTPFTKVCSLFDYYDIMNLDGQRAAQQGFREDGRGSLKEANKKLAGLRVCWL